MIVLKRPALGIFTGLVVSSLLISIVAVLVLAIDLSHQSLDEAEFSTVFVDVFAYPESWMLVAMFVPAIMAIGVPCLLFIGWPLWSWVLSKQLGSGVAAFWVGSFTTAVPIFFGSILFLHMPFATNMVLSAFCGVIGAIGGLIAWSVAYEEEELSDV